MRAIAETEPGMELVYDSLQTTTIQTTSLDILVCLGGQLQAWLPAWSPDRSGFFGGVRISVNPHEGWGCCKDEDLWPIKWDRIMAYCAQSLAESSFLPQRP